MPVTDTTVTKPFRNAVITIFFEKNPVPNWDDLKKHIKYFAYGLEHTEEGKPHYQAFAVAWKPMRFSQWLKLFKPHHLEKMYGSVLESEGYCSKETRLTEFGTKPNENGKTTSVLSYKRKLEEGQNVLDVAQEDEHFETFLRYRNGLHEYKRHCLEKKSQEDGFRKPELYIRVGAPRTGKTRWVFDTYGIGNVIVICGSMLRKQWFPTYVRDVVLFDDVEDGTIMPLSDFKNLTDGYPRTFECKGGYVHWHPKVIVFTSNTGPFTWWSKLSPYDKTAIQERITETVFLK